MEAIRFYVRVGLELLRRYRFDCIVAYSHMTTGVLAAALKLVSGVKMIVEIVTAPDLVFLTDAPRPGLSGRLRHVCSDVCLHISVGLSNRAHLLFPGALAAYGWLKHKKTSVFHDFVPVCRIPRRKSEGRYLLLVGAPWYSKGVDVLVEAFRSLAADFPDLELKLLGHYEDQAGLNAILRDVPRVELLPARPNPEALQVIADATAMVLPSRCEGMPRVLIEAMAAAVPVIASDIGGILFLLKNGECGLISPVGDAVELAERLRQLLNDAALRQRLSNAGYCRAHSELNERTYVQQFTGMIEMAAGD